MPPMTPVCNCIGTLDLKKWGISGRWGITSANGSILLSWNWCWIRPGIRWRGRVSVICFDKIRHYLINGQCHACRAEQVPVNKAESLRLLFFCIDPHLPLVKIKGFIAQGGLYRLQGFRKIIDGDDLVFGVESRHLEKIGGIEMISDAYIQVHLFLELSFQAIPCAFSEFQTAAGEFCIITAADVLVADQHFFIFSQQDAVYSQIEHDAII